jgi:hypothetical protein
MKKFKNIFFFIIKVKNLLFFFNFNVNEIFEITLNDNNDEKIKKNNNMLLTIVQLTYPLRKVFYGLIVLTFLNTYFSDIIDKDTVLTIVTMIDAIDKSIVEGISETDELSLNKKDNIIVEDSYKIEDTISNEVKKSKDNENDNNN